MTENQFYEYLYQQEQRSKAMNEWQPIETAPKDGTEIDVWGNEARFTEVKFSDGKWKIWDIDEFDSMSWVTLTVLITHWMPLPEPPTE